jgi:hypothetical protein
MKLLIVPTLLLLVGLALVTLNSDAPRMVRSDWAAQVKEGDSDAYFRAYDENISPRARLFDLGAGLAGLSASLIALLLVTRAWSIARVRALHTPRSRALIFVLFNVSWICYAWGATRFIAMQLRRDEFPPWADSIAMPIAGILVFAGIGLIVINAALIVYLHGAKLPAPMWTAPNTVGAWVLNSIVAIALLALLWATYNAVRIGDIFTLPEIVAIAYLLLVGRAAACAG